MRERPERPGINLTAVRTTLLSLSSATIAALLLSLTGAAAQDPDRIFLNEHLERTTGRKAMFYRIWEGMEGQYFIGRTYSMDGKLKAGDVVKADTLATLGICRKEKDGVRLLGKGELKTQLNLEVAYATGSAIAAVKKAGGSVKVIGVKAKHVTRKDREPGKRAQRRVTAAKKKEDRAATRAS